MGNGSFTRPLKLCGDALSPREVEVLQLYTAGMTGQEMCSQLCIAQKTLDTHIRNIREKFGQRTCMGVLRAAIERGYIWLTPSQHQHEWQKFRRCACGAIEELPEGRIARKTSFLY